MVCPLFLEIKISKDITNLVECCQQNPRTPLVLQQQSKTLKSVEKEGSQGPLRPLPRSAFLQYFINGPIIALSRCHGKYMGPGPGY